MPRLIFTLAALADLEAVGEYVESKSGSIDVAERFVGRLVGRCEKLAALPNLMGRPRPELIPGLRSVADGNYVIFIRYLGPSGAPETLEIIRIVERHRDVQEIFSDPPSENAV